MTAAFWSGGAWNRHTLKGVGPQRPLRDCNVEEVAAHFGMVERTGGMSFATEAERPNKRAARDLVLDLFGPERRPDPIRVLSMPGLKWKMESALLKLRETKDLWGKWEGLDGPKRTCIHAVENDRAIFYEAMLRVPGMRHAKNVLVDRGSTSYAERIISYLWINQYIFTDIDSMMSAGVGRYDGVWLDYLGPLTRERLHLIKTYFENNVDDAIVITSMKARWNIGISTLLSDYDDFEDFLCDQFDDYKIEHYVEYFDTCPMVQIAVSKR